MTHAAPPHVDPRPRPGLMPHHPEPVRIATKESHMTSGLTVTVNDQSVPLDACGWLQRRPCGCIVSAVIAVVDGEGGWVLATADQASRHLLPTKRDRDKADRAGLRMELITMAYYQANIGAKWECAEHAATAATPAP